MEYCLSRTFVWVFEIGMRKVFLGLILVTTVCIDSSLGHGGRLDSKGCHTRSKTGEYHCHEGQNGSETDFGSKKNEDAFTYDRKDYRFHTYQSGSNIGFYTGKDCKTSIDHVVSLKDAHESGARFWSNEIRELFANDQMNHVPACTQINSSKGSSTPFEFIRKSADSEGLDYSVISKCAYLGIYYQVKIYYELSFENNNSDLFRECGLYTN